MLLIMGSALCAGHGSFVSRSGRTVRRGPRGYSPEPDPTRELSSSLPRNYGACAPLPALLTPNPPPPPFGLEPDCQVPLSWSIYGL